MKCCNIIFVVLTLSVAVNGAWWAAATQPIALTIGAAFAALNLDIEPLLDNLSIFKTEANGIGFIDSKNKNNDDIKKSIEIWNKLIGQHERDWAAGKRGQDPDKDQKDAMTKIGKGKGGEGGYIKGVNQKPKEKKVSEEDRD